MTEFAVATANQATNLKYIKGGNADGLREPMSLKLSRHRGWGDPETNTILQLVERGWIKYTPKSPHRDNSGYILTDAGKLALELREALGPDRGLTRAGAKGLLKGGATRATRLRLMQDGLWHRGYMLGVEDAWLTEDGLKVREILRKYRVEV